MQICISPHPITQFIYRPNARPAAQPTASKHRRQLFFANVGLHINSQQTTNTAVDIDIVYLLLNLFGSLTAVCHQQLGSSSVCQTDGQTDEHTMMANIALAQHRVVKTKVKLFTLIFVDSNLLKHKISENVKCLIVKLLT